MEMRAGRGGGRAIGPPPAAGPAPPPAPPAPPPPAQADEPPAPPVRPGEAVGSERLATEAGQPFGERGNLDASHVESAIEFRVVVAPTALLRPWVEQRAAGRRCAGRRGTGR